MKLTPDHVRTALLHAQGLTELPASATKADVRSTIRRMHVLQIDTVRAQKFECFVRETVGSNTCKQTDFGPGTSRRQRLVRPLAARRRSECAARDGLTRPRDPAHRADQI